MPARSSSGEIQVECNDLIVSKTDLDSRITYANKAFCYYSGFQEKELLGQPQNIVRHSDMPRAIFYLMWEHLKQDQEFFGYVKNHRKDGVITGPLPALHPCMKTARKPVIYPPDAVLVKALFK